MTTSRQSSGATHSPAVYRVPEAAELLGVSADTVRRWADTGRLASTRDSAGRRVIEGSVLAAFAAQPGRAQSLEVGPTGGHSARNRFVGIVTKVTKDTVMAQVEMQVPVDGRKRFRGELKGTEGDCARLRWDGAANETSEILLRIDDMLEAKLVLTDTLISQSLRKSKQNHRKGD